MLLCKHTRVLLLLYFVTVFVIICSYQVIHLTASFCLLLGSVQPFGLSPLGWYWAMRMNQRRKLHWWGKQAFHHLTTTAVAPPWPCPHCPPKPPPPYSSFWSKRPSSALTSLASCQHGNPLPVEAVLPEAGVLPGQFWVHLGDDAAALHHSATSQPREQRCAEAANPGPQQALHKGSGRGEPERHGWALCGHHDGLRWVTLQKCVLGFNVLLQTGSVLKRWCTLRVV